MQAGPYQYEVASCSLTVSKSESTIAAPGPTAGPPANRSSTTVDAHPSLAGA